MIRTPAGIWDKYCLSDTVRDFQGTRYSHSVSDGGAACGSFAHVPHHWCPDDAHELQGVLLRQLASDPLLTNYSVIIIDEVRRSRVA
jgi:hypothetical protein